MDKKDKIILEDLINLNTMMDSIFITMDKIKKKVDQIKKELDKKEIENKEKYDKI
jgi:hypothetical protein